MEFGEKILAARNAAGLSRKKLSTITGISIHSIQSYESGKCLPRRMDKYTSLASALNLDVSSLIDENEAFILKAGEKYGYRGKKQAKELVQEITEMIQADPGLKSDGVIQFLQEAFWIAKEKSKKFTRKDYLNRIGNLP